MRGNENRGDSAPPSHGRHDVRDANVAPAAPLTELRVLAFVPAFNEEGKIGAVVSKIPRHIVHEILVFDDGSTDGTAEEARRHGARVHSSPERGGVGKAIRHGLHDAKARGFDVIVILAGNDKDDPSQIPRLLAPIEDQGCLVVQGSRYLAGGGYGNMPRYRTIATRYVHPILFSLFAGRRFTDSTNGFRAIRLSLLDDPGIDIDQAWLDRYELEPYLLFLATRRGHSVREVPVAKVYPEWRKGYTKMRPITGWWSILRPIVLLGLGIRR